MLRLIHILLGEWCYKLKKIKSIVFITGTRADYGKLKPLIKKAQNSFNTHIFVCGMHLLPQYGTTSNYILNDGYENVHFANDIVFAGKMDVDLASTIVSLNSYINNVKPDLIIVHGDRIDALAGAISGMLNNILVGHVEGGEITGTVDETIRHSISKMAHYHFVANYESKLRVLQLGERRENIHVIGSPDIDIMLSQKLPKLDDVKEKNKIEFSEFAILIYHPVTTEVEAIKNNIRQLLKATEASEKNYIVIYPNNDLGGDIVIGQIEKFKTHNNYKLFRSLPFEDFLVLLKNALFIIGNSSSGVRQACVYGIPAIDIGSRQQGRYPKAFLKNIQHATENSREILACINRTNYHNFSSNYFGEGNSANLFIDILKSEGEVSVQKKFIDTSETQEAINNYINEVCF